MKLLLINLLAVVVTIACRAQAEKSLYPETVVNESLCHGTLNKFFHKCDSCCASKGYEALKGDFPHCLCAKEAIVQPEQKTYYKYISDDLEVCLKKAPARKGLTCGECCEKEGYNSHVTEENSWTGICKCEKKDLFEYDQIKDKLEAGERFGVLYKYDQIQ